MRLSHDMTLCIVEHTIFLHVEFAIDDELANIAIGWGSGRLDAGSSLFWLETERKACFVATCWQVDCIVI